MTTNEKNHIPDYEQIFMEAEEKERQKRSNAIPKMLLKNNVLTLLASTVLYIAKSLAVWCIPLITAEVINTISSNKPDMLKKIAFYGLVLFVILILNYPLNMIYSKHIDKKIRDLSAGLRNTLIRKLQHLSITYHKELESGKVQAKFMRDIEAIEQLCVYFSKLVVPMIAEAIIYVIILSSRSIKVTIFFFITLPANILLILFFKRIMNKSNYDFRRVNESVSAKVSDMIDMIPVTKAHGLENEEISILEQKIDILRKKGLDVDKVNAKFGAVAWIISQMMCTFCLFFTAYLAIKGEILVGDIVLYQSYFGNISGSLRNIINVYPIITKGLDSIHSVSEIVLSNEIEDNAGKIRLRYVHGTVSFENVSFRYPDAKESLIKNFSLSVEPGECVAFVGASGSGKSTIMNMIIGFLQATEGTVKIDGKPINELNLSDYRHFISVVPQNCILFTGSIKDNITYGLNNVSKERLDEVIKLSNIDEFAKDLPQGLDTPVGEGGTKLSGGQKQRISIARALIRDPKILVLDEATSALDNISEQHIQNAIDHLTKGRTTFIVAHRLSTIRNADRIVVMEKGSCVETGTYEELMQKQGKFYELEKLTER